MFYGNIINESSEVSSISVEVNGKKYEVEPGYKITSDIMSSSKKKIIARIKAILGKEDYIKKQIYDLYKDAKNIEKDHIEQFSVEAVSHNEFKSDGFEIGIFFTNINQFYTMVDKKFKIYENETYIY